MEPDKSEICRQCAGMGTVMQLLMSQAALQKISKLAEILPNEGVPTSTITCPICKGTGYALASRQPGVGERPEMNQAEWEARGEPPVVPSEAAPETKLVCPYDKQQCEYPRCLGGNDVYADPLCKNNLAASQLPAPEVNLPELDITPFEKSAAEHIPSSIARPFVQKLLCRERQLLTALSDLAAARKEIATWKKLYDETNSECANKQLQIIVLKAELTVLRDSHARLESSLAAAKTEGFNEGVEAARLAYMAHYHEHDDRSGGGDACKRCGDDLRDRIHLRVGETCGERIRALKSQEGK